MTRQFKKSNNTGSAIKVAAKYFTIVVVFSLLTGCSSTGSKQALSAAVSDYNAMNYSSAQRRASLVAKKSNGTLKDQAAYLSGLSAYKLGDLVEAELQLSKAVRSKDQTTAARAKAVLGLIRVDQDRPEDAAGLLSEASISMQGEDSRQAAYQAALAHEEAGYKEPGLAIGPSASRRTAQSWSQAVAGRKAFTLQFGAFHELKRAKAAARKIAELAQTNDLGRVRIVKNLDDRGKTLFLVQVGRFPSRFYANDMHKQIGRKDLIVAPLAVPTL